MIVYVMKMSSLENSILYKFWPTYRLCFGLHIDFDTDSEALA